MRLKFARLIAALVLGPVALGAVLTPVTASAQFKRTLPRAVGTVTADNAGRYTAFISERQDQLIAVKLTIRPSTDADFQDKHYLASIDGDLLVVFKEDGEDSVEVVVAKDEARAVGGAYVLDGFYTVRSGGTHQGTLSYGLERMDPRMATAGGVKIVDTVIEP